MRSSSVSMTDKLLVLDLVPPECWGGVIQSLPLRDVEAFANSSHQARRIALDTLRNGFESLGDWVERPIETEHQHNTGAHPVPLPFTVDKLNKPNHFTVFLRLIARSESLPLFWNTLRIVDNAFHSRVAPVPSFLTLDPIACFRTGFSLFTDEAEGIPETSSISTREERGQTRAMVIWPRDTTCVPEKFFLEITSTLLDNYLAGVARGDLKVPVGEVFDPSLRFLLQGENQCADSKLIKKLQNSYSIPSLVQLIGHAVTADNGEVLLSLLKMFPKAENYTEACTIAVFKKWIPVAREKKKTKVLEILLKHRAKNEAKRFFNSHAALLGLSLYKVLDQAFVNEVTCPIAPQLRFGLAACLGLAVEYKLCENTTFLTKYGFPSCYSLLCATLLRQTTNSNAATETLSSRAKVLCLHATSQGAGLMGLFASRWIDNEPSKVKRNVMYGITLAPWIALSCVTGDYTIAPHAALSLYQANAVRSGKL